MLIRTLRTTWRRRRPSFVPIVRCCPGATGSCPSGTVRVILPIAIYLLVACIVTTAQRHSSAFNWSLNCLLECFCLFLETSKRLLPFLQDSFTRSKEIECWRDFLWCRAVPLGGRLVKLTVLRFFFFWSRDFNVLSEVWDGLCLLSYCFVIWWEVFRI